MKPSLVPARLGSGYRTGHVCFCKPLILYANEFIIDKKCGITFRVYVGIIIRIFIVLVKVYLGIINTILSYRCDFRKSKRFLHFV